MTAQTTATVSSVNPVVVATALDVRFGDDGAGMHLIRAAKTAMTKSCAGRLRWLRPSTASTKTAGRRSPGP
jgi:hypothetical protein